MKIENINPSSLNSDFSNLYVHGKKVSGINGLLFISGQIGMRKDGSVGETCKEQIELVWSNVDAILKDAGMARKNIVEVFVFMNGAPQHDLDENKRLFAQSSIEYFGENVPTMSALVSAGLWSDDLCLEVKVTAAE